ncbi:DNA replication/repair protein RecF [Elstera sp.]|uniref:DNA replication/repair protein RecF n=1 Tax=Elstera sp. TaxID=1916664 RepID=UPI0037BF14B9
MSPVSLTIPALSRVRLHDFRSHAALDLTVEAPCVILTGDNGVGKTNLLEALSFLAPGRGFRRAAIQEIDRQDGPGGWSMQVALDTAHGSVEIATGRVPAQGDRRQIRIDGEPAKSQSALSDLLVVSWLTPVMDRLFQEGASARRRFLDRIVHGFLPDHLQHLSRYEAAQRDRLRLLREGEGGKRPDPHWLAALEDTMASDGTAIAAARCDITQRLSLAMAAGVGPFPAADLAMLGTLEQALAEKPALEVEEDFRRTLRQTRPRDAAAGTTTEGPHRSDWQVIHRLKQMPAALCSTGEQKALLIAILLANARLIRTARGAPPLLLLDEVAAHLDPGRRQALAEELFSLGGQAWLTGTEPGLFAAFGAVYTSHIHL